MDFDILLLTNSGKIACERKATPGDFISSVQDGRLQREVVAMREVSDINIIIQHGTFRYDKDCHLIVPGMKYRERKDGEKARSGWTRKGIRNLKRTLTYVEGLYIEEAADDEDLVDVVNSLQEYFDEKTHSALRRRPSIQSNWFSPTRDEKVQYFYQGLPGIKDIRAHDLQALFHNPMDIYQASVEEIMECPGIGHKIATSIYNFLREG